MPSKEPEVTEVDRPVTSLGGSRAAKHLPGGHTFVPTPTTTL